jgi:hypothetical protein
MCRKIRFDKVPSGCGCDDLSVPTSEELRNAIGMIKMAMSADYVVLALTAWIERFVVILFDWIVLKIRTQMDILVWPSSA